MDFLSKTRKQLSVKQITLIELARANLGILRVKFKKYNIIENFNILNPFYSCKIDGTEGKKKGRPSRREEKK